MKTPITGAARRAPQERLASVGVRGKLARIVMDRWKVHEPEERRLDAMSHWRDPIERLSVHHGRRRTLIDDNPSSG